MAVQRIGLQASSANLTADKLITVDANGFLINTSYTADIYTLLAAASLAAARVALGVTDANDRMPTAMHPSRELSHYFHASWDEKITVAGTWGEYESGGNQTDYDSSLVSATYVIQNAGTHANNDEIHFGSLTLNAGTYKILIAGVRDTSAGILEILLGTTSLGTFDLYGGSTVWNYVTTLTYSPTTRVTGNLRVKCTGKNASSSNHYIIFSRLEIIRTS